MYNHEIYQWSVYDGLSTSRLTNCTLLVYSINTDYQTTKFMKLGVSKLLSQTHILCYCVSCDAWILSSAVYYCDRVLVFIINMLFSVPGYFYDHAQGVCFFHYCINVTIIIVHPFQTLKFKLCVVANGVSTICFRDVSYIIAICNKYSIHKTLKVQTVCS